MFFYLRTILYETTWEQILDKPRWVWCFPSFSILLLEITILGGSTNVAYNSILHRVLHVVARVRSKKATPKSTEGFREMPHNLFEGFHILPSVLATTNRLKLRSSLIRLFIIWDISCRSKDLRCSICTSLGVLCFLKWSFVDTLIN